MIKESHLNINQAARYEEVLAGDYWMQPLLKNQTLRIVDLHGNQAADTLFYSVADPAERYSAIDTIREQKNVYLTAGTTLLTNMGNPMLTITADTCGLHDTLGGACATAVSYTHLTLPTICSV